MILSDDMASLIFLILQTTLKATLFGRGGGGEGKKKKKKTQEVIQKK